MTIKKLLRVIYLSRPLFIINSLVVSLLISVTAEAQETEIEKFDLVKEAPPAFIYERWITFPGKVPPVRAREVKSEFLVNASIYTVLSILKDESKIKNWQSHVSEFEVHTNPDTSTWLEYSYHDIPWPVSDQDHFLRYYIEAKVPGKELFIRFESVTDPKLAPLRKGVSRMELAGSWRLEQLSENQVKATYRILSMPSSIPRMFTDPVIRSNMMSTVQALTKLAERK